MKENNNKNKLILSLDCSNLAELKQIVYELEETVEFYKIGLELMASGEYFTAIDFLAKNNKKIFADLKLYDIDNTVAKAVANISKMPIELLTIHIANQSMMKRAVENAGNVKIIGVTVLTNLINYDLATMGFDQKLSLEELVLKKAKLAIECGLAGVVASPQETAYLRQNIGKDFLIVTPGIRLENIADLESSNKNNQIDDQKRIATPKQAIINGSSYLVIGRPILQSSDKKAMALKILSQINQ
jgi:orotidine-5'-phosphate decarboxylase